MIPPERQVGQTASSPSLRVRASLAAALLVALTVEASIPPLQETDEGRSASICWEMLRSGDWVTPHLNSIAYYEKPPLYFWLGASAQALAGRTDWAVRIPSVLASFLTVLLVVHWGARTRGIRSGLLAGAILSSLLLFALLCRAAMVDPLLTLWITLASYGGYRLLEDPRPRRRWSILLWAALGGAALVKGPIGVVIPLASLAGYALWRSRREGLGMFFHPAALGLFLLIVVPWYWSMSRRNPGYLGDFILGQNLDRLLEGSRFNRNKPFWYYFAVLAIGFLPWSMFLVQVAARIRQAATDRDRPESRTRMYWAWAMGVPFVLLTLAHSKLAHYLLPLCPPFALLLADVLLSAWEKEPGSSRGALGTRHFAILGILLLSLAGIALVPAQMDAHSLYRRLPFDSEGFSREVDLARIRTYQAPLRGASAILAFLGGSALWAARRFRRGRPTSAAGLMTASVILGAVGLQFLVAPMGPAISSRALALKVSALATPDVPVILYRRYLRGLTYYLERPVTLWEALYNEFGHEVDETHPDERSLRASPEKLRAALGRDSRTVIVVESAWRLEELRELTSRTFDELGREGDFIIVRAHRDP